MSVLVVGDVIQDILVSPNTQIRIDTDTESHIETASGGSAANFACWLSATGTQVDFVGRVGASDKDQESFELARHGVRAHLQTDKVLPTGRIVILVQGQARSFLTDRGANKNLELDKIPDSLFSKALYISGYSLLTASEESVRKLISRAKAAGLLVVCDPGSAGFIEDFGALRFLKALEGVDVFLPSLQEGRVLTGEDSPEIIADILSARFPIIALKLGSEGVQLVGDGLNSRIPAPAADLIDATGAGDAFSASFLHQILSGASLEVAAKAACVSGAKAVTFFGGRPQITT